MYRKHEHPNNIGDPDPMLQAWEAFPLPGGLRTGLAWVSRSSLWGGP